MEGGCEEGESREDITNRKLLFIIKIGRLLT